MSVEWSATNGHWSYHPCPPKAQSHCRKGADMFSELESGRARSNVFLMQQDPVIINSQHPWLSHKTDKTSSTMEEGGAHKPPPLTEELWVVVDSFCRRDSSLKCVVPGRPTTLQGWTGWEGEKSDCMLSMYEDIRLHSVHVWRCQRTNAIQRNGKTTDRRMKEFYSLITDKKKKLVSWGWRNVPVVKRTYCLCSGSYVGELTTACNPYWREEPVKGETPAPEAQCATRLCPGFLKAACCLILGTWMGHAAWTISSRVPPVVLPPLPR